MSTGPALIVWEVTRDCPLACLYCYNVWKDPDFPLPESLPDPETVVSAIAAARPSAVTLTGGEPLLVPGLADLVSRLAGEGLLVGVATSGLLLDRARAGELAAAGTKRFEVSLPAADREGYRRMTRTDGFLLAKRSMLAAVDAGAGLTVSHVMTAADPRGTWAVVEMAFALGAEAVALNRFVPGGEGLRYERELSPSPEDLSAALRAADQAARRFPVPVHVTLPVEECLEAHAGYPGLRFSRCSCGEAKWAVDPSGSLRICEQSPVVLGSLLESSFSELISDPAVGVFRAADRTASCPTCPAYRSCGGGCRFLRRPGGRFRSGNGMSIFEPASVEESGPLPSETGGGRNVGC